MSRKKGGERNLLLQRQLVICYKYKMSTDKIYEKLILFFPFSAFKSANYTIKLCYGIALYHFFAKQNLRQR